VNVRPATAGDGTAVEHLLEQVLGPVSRPLGLYRSVHGPPQDEPRVRRSFLAEDDGQLVGVGSCMTSGRHPGRNQVAVHVVRSRRRRGIGGALLGALEAAMVEAGHPAPWMVSVLDTDGTSRAVLDHVGWALLATSRSGTVDVVASMRRADEPPGVRVEARDDLDDDLVDLYEALYDQYHEWAQPYVRYAGGRSWASFLGEALPGTVHVAIDGSGRAVGVASLHGDPGCPLLAPTGVLAGVGDGRRIVAALVQAVLSAAAEAGVDEVEWEADDAYGDLWAALRPLSLDRWDDLLVFGGPTRSAAG
jgi:GNAT superfamily N-acetyltransferase